MHNLNEIHVGDLKEKRILVTGGSTGIGAAVALAFARQGAKIVVHYNESASAAEDLRERSGRQIELVAGDLGRSGAAAQVVRKACEILGGLDGLINNAGGMLGRVRTTEISQDHFERVLNLNARSVWEASIAAHPYLKAGRNGFIINTSSIAARNGGGSGAVLYAAAKSFVSNLSRGQAKEFVGDGIRVNCVSPGVVRTAFHDRYTPDDLLALQQATIPMGRLGTPDECVGAFLFLASNTLSGYITGQTIEVNGGQLMP